MKTKHMISAVCSILFLTCFTFIQPTSLRAEEGKGEKGREWFKAKMDEKMAEVHKELGVTPEQEQKLKEYREKNHEQMKALQEQLKQKRDAIRQELEKADFNEAQVKTIHNELKSLLSQKEDLRLEGILEVRKILTPDQFKKFSDMMKDKKGFGMGMGRGGGEWKHKKDHGDKDHDEDDK